ncbi:AFG1-like ATPase [Chlorella vulgaris]
MWRLALSRAARQRAVAVAPQHLGIHSVAAATQPVGNRPSGDRSASDGGTQLTDRYAALVSSGALRHDAHQAAVVARLDRLRCDLAEHTEEVARYQHSHAAREAVRAQLVSEEEARLAAEEVKTAASSDSGMSGMRKWLSAVLGGSEGGQGAPPQRRTAAQRLTLARARVEPRLAQQLGPPPAPPSAPKGIYLHGSVGSGKSLLMDLLSASVQQEGVVPHHRRLHFNSAMLELHSRMHAIESRRMDQEQQQMAVYAAAVQEQQQLDQQAVAAKAAAASAEEEAEAAGSSGSGWQHILKLDPMAQKMRRSKLARLAFRRMMRQMLSRTASQHSQALAAANAPVLLNAARALIRNCDTLQLLDASSGGPAFAGGAQEQRISALLCFDEVQVSDPFTAAALKGLVEALVAEGCVIVATSNRAPGELDRHGLHEHLFTHFVASLELACDVISLSSDQDYRRLLASDQAPLQPLLSTPLPTGAQLNGGSMAAGGAQAAAVAGISPQAGYFYPLGAAAEAALELQWQRVTSAADMPSQQQQQQQQQHQVLSSRAEQSTELEVMFGRKLQVARSSGGTAWFSFPELCARNLGPADYLAVAQTYHTVFLAGVPPMSMQVRDQARRFITLVDELYNCRTRLVCSAAAPPDQLFVGAAHEEPIVDLESLQFESAVEGSRLRRDLTQDGGVAPVGATSADAAAVSRRLGGAEEQFAFARAVSRLYEMQSVPYLASRPRQA